MLFTERRTINNPATTLKRFLMGLDLVSQLCLMVSPIVLDLKDEN
jgi:hypothetical protein